MKLTVEERPDLEEAEVTIRCPAIDRRVRAIMATANAVDCRLLGTDGTGTFIVEPSEVLYAETVDGRTFLYGRDRVLESPLRLYELEEALAGTEFVRASKSLIVNFDHVRALRPYLNAPGWSWYSITANPSSPRASTPRPSSRRSGCRKDSPMRNIVKSAFVRACITFTVAMALWCTAGLIFAGPVEGIVITLSLLAAALALCALQAFWFTEAVIGRLSYPARIAGFGLTGLPALVLCAALGGWFPLDNIGAWVSFVAIYLVTLAAITAGYTIYYRRTAGSFDAALARYREGRKE